MIFLSAISGIYRLFVFFIVPKAEEAWHVYYNHTYLYFENVITRREKLKECPLVIA